MGPPGNANLIGALLTLLPPAARLVESPANAIVDIDVFGIDVGDGRDAGKRTEIYVAAAAPLTRATLTRRRTAPTASPTGLLRLSAQPLRSSRSAGQRPSRARSRPTTSSSKRALAGGTSATRTKSSRRTRITKATLRRKTTRSRPSASSRPSSTRTPPTCRGHLRLPSSARWHPSMPRSSFLPTRGRITS